MVQDADLADLDLDRLQVVTKVQPTDEQMASLLFGWKVVKHVKSNAIVLASGRQIIGVGAGQMNRITAAQLAIAQAKERAQGVFWPRAFFPCDVVSAASRSENHHSTEWFYPDQDSIDAAGMGLPWSLRGSGISSTNTWWE